MIRVKWNLRAEAGWRFRWVWLAHDRSAVLDLGRLIISFPWLTSEWW